MNTILTPYRYLAYYFPFFNWASQYKLSYLKGDTIAALTMASFYIPMSLSYASNLGHIPPINGLYAFVFNPLIYAFLGTSLQMVVGPEAAGSLLVGSVVRSSVELGHSGDEDEETNARIAGVVTGMAGAAIFVAGLTRLGFLDNVLSRPFLRGFISAIGFVILVNELIPEMGLTQLSKHAGVSHGTSFDKLIFIFKKMGIAHALTCAEALPLSWSAGLLRNDYNLEFRPWHMFQIGSLSWHCRRYAHGVLVGTRRDSQFWEMFNQALAVHSPFDYLLYPLT